MASVTLGSDTLIATPAAGQLEYDGKVAYITPQGTQRGVIPGAQFFRLNADLVGTQALTAQNIFGVGVTLSASTVYAFESLIVLQKTAGTTSHSVGLGFGGTATLNNTLYEIINGSVNQAAFPVVRDTLSYDTANAATSTSVTGSITTANFIITNRLWGTVSINAGGTFIPQYTLSAAPGGAYSTVAGSYFMIYPIGTSGANTSVGTWA
jgi:hypothetical protein